MRDSRLPDRKGRPHERAHTSSWGAPHRKHWAATRPASIYSAACARAAVRERSVNWATDFYLQAPCSPQVPFRRPLRILQRARFPTAEDVQEPSAGRHRSSGLGRHGDEVLGSAV